MQVNEDTLKFFQNHLGYSDEEMSTFKDNPKNLHVLSKASELSNKTIIMEVVESHGCNSQHKVGDRFIFDGAGNLVTKLNPSRICIYALHAMSALIYGAQELFYADVDPNQACFKRVGCHDVGVKCGGWGHIAMEIKMEDRKKS
ncbi:hypothetical protein KJ966_05535 [bacterium]|nr:hypothetical protein [bacterium]